MSVFHTILENDKSIIDNTNVNSSIYRLVKEFVYTYHLQERTKGSLLTFWLNIDCEGTVLEKHYPYITSQGQSYCFEINISDNLIEKIIKLLNKSFGDSLSEMIDHNCTLEIGKEV